MMIYDFRCPMCSTDMIVKRWESLLGNKKPWCFCPRCRYECFAKQEPSKDVVNIVIINDSGDYIVQTYVDSLWYNWEDAAKRVHELNEEFEQDEWSDCHAHYYQEVVQ